MCGRVTVRPQLVGVGNLPPIWVVNQPLSYHKLRHALDRHLRVTALTHVSPFKPSVRMCVCVFVSYTESSVLFVHTLESFEQYNKAT